jgi:hypothetical protein
MLRLQCWEVMADAARRTPARGYVYPTDTTRQKFTCYERDTQTDLGYAQARYLASAQARRAGVGPLLASAVTSASRSWDASPIVSPKILTAR